MIKELPVFDVYVNDKKIIDRISWFEMYENILTVDGYEALDSDIAFVEIFFQNGLVIWKDPVRPNSHYSLDVPHKYHCDYKLSKRMDHEPIIWDKDIYLEFANRFINRDMIEIYDTKFTREYKYIRKVIPNIGLSIKHGEDLWRLHGQRSISNNFYQNYTIYQLFEMSFGLYSINYAEDECVSIVSKARELWDMATKVSLINVDEIVFDDKIIVMYDDIEYKEWESIFLKDDKIFYPIDKDFVICLDN